MQIDGGPDGRHREFGGICSMSVHYDIVPAVGTPEIEGTCRQIKKCKQIREMLVSYDLVTAVGTHAKLYQDMCVDEQETDNGARLKPQTT